MHSAFLFTNLFAPFKQGAKSNDLISILSDLIILVRSDVAKVVAVFKIIILLSFQVTYQTYLFISQIF